MSGQRFKGLSARLRALVAVAVLLDGNEAGLYLENDAVHGEGLKRAAAELEAHDRELRLPLVGTLLRSALAELGDTKHGAKR